MNLAKSVSVRGWVTLAVLTGHTILVLYSAYIAYHWDLRADTLGTAWGLIYVVDFPISLPASFFSANNDARGAVLIPMVYFLMAGGAQWYLILRIWSN